MASIFGNPGSTARAEAASGLLARHAPLFATALAVVGILLVHADTALSIEAIWRRSETFAHGYLVVPIAIWLAWRNRDALSATPAGPWVPALLGVALAGGFWLVMFMADVLGLRQFALAFMLQAAIVAVVGLRIARAIAFPLLFLLFAVPAGEFLVPTMIEYTADFTVMALRASGVPVYREANHFIIPSGAWSVVEACSGLRYLIASMMIGVLYAALRYRSTGRRIAFVAASIIVPIVANWLRAYMIVMIGHLSNNTLAVGVDHLIYGWVFFGVVMALLFWVGSFWSEDDVPAPATRESASQPARASPALPVYAVAGAAIVAAGMWVPLQAALDRPVAHAPIALPPIQATGGWTASQDTVAQWKPAYRGYSAELAQAFNRNGESAGVYVAYYRDPRRGSQLVTSANHLVRPADNQWRLMQIDDAAVVLEGRSRPVARAVIGSNWDRLSVYRLYWIDGTVTSSDYMAKALLAWSRLTGRSGDSALVVVFAQQRDERDVALDALQGLWPSIARTLAAARDAT